MPNLHFAEALLTIINLGDTKMSDKSEKQAQEGMSRRQFVGATLAAAGGERTDSRHRIRGEKCPTGSRVYAWID